jgi:hypothetical protein
MIYRMKQNNSTSVIPGTFSCVSIPERFSSLVIPGRDMTDVLARISVIGDLLGKWEIECILASCDKGGVTVEQEKIFPERYLAVDARPYLIMAIPYGCRKFMLAMEKLQIYILIRNHYLMSLGGEEKEGFIAGWRFEQERTKIFESYCELVEAIYEDSEEKLCLDTDLCPITLGKIREPMITHCGHRFETKALLQALTNSPNCPLCRAVI